MARNAPDSASSNERAAPARALQVAKKLKKLAASGSRAISPKLLAESAELLEGLSRSVAANKRQSAAAQATTETLDRIRSDATAQRIIAAIDDSRLSMSELANRIFPGMQAASAASMLSRRIADLVDAGLVVQIRERKNRFASLTPLASRLRTDVDHSSHDFIRGELTTAVRSYPACFQEEDLWSDRTRFHLASASLYLAQGLLARKLWTERDATLARVVTVIFLTARPAASDTAMARELLSSWSHDDHVARLMVICAQFINSPKLRASLFDELSALELDGDFLLLWASMANVVASRQGGNTSDRVHRQQLLSNVCDRLAAFDNPAALHRQAAALRALRLGKDASSTWSKVAERARNAAVSSGSQDADEAQKKHLNRLAEAAITNQTVVQNEEQSNAIYGNWMLQQGGRREWLEGVLCEAHANGFVKWLKDLRPKQGFLERPPPSVTPNLYAESRDPFSEARAYYEGQRAPTWNSLPGLLLDNQDYVGTILERINWLGINEIGG